MVLPGRLIQPLETWNHDIQRERRLYSGTDVPDQLSGSALPHRRPHHLCRHRMLFAVHAGNLFRESGVMDRLFWMVRIAVRVSSRFSGDLVPAMDTVRYPDSADAAHHPARFIAFIFGTAGGVNGVTMCRWSGWKIPLIGSAGVSAVPMAARVSQVVGMKVKPGNYLLMDAMGPNVAGVIGTAVALAPCWLCSSNP